MTRLRHRGHRDLPGLLAILLAALVLPLPFAASLAGQSQYPWQGSGTVAAAGSAHEPSAIHPWEGRGLGTPAARVTSTGAGANAGANAGGDAAAVAAVRMVGLTVSDMDRSVDFYTKVLTFEPVSDVEVTGAEYERLEGVFGVRMRVVRLRLGDETIELTEYLPPRGGRPAPIDSRSNDGWFQHVAIIVSDMDSAYQRLRRHKVRHASTGPQRLPDSNPAAGGIRAFYFLDPDGHPLEILQFPKGKGDQRWHRPTGRLFLGIDHTAIVVSDTERSLRFYRDLLGLSIAGESRNEGIEQEHLNSVAGARLRITSLRAATGPGIEFLEYLAPRDGRPMPADERANDLVHWETTLAAANVDSVAAKLRRGRARPVSPGVVRLSGPALGFSKGVLVRDPDGHVIQLVQ